tara:strand:- start:3673 stop:3789 length:117 start_codon:yes stop_codon:yes gene_type:complete
MKNLAKKIKTKLTKLTDSQAAMLVLGVIVIVIILWAIL